MERFGAMSMSIHLPYSMGSQGAAKSLPTTWKCLVGPGWWFGTFVIFHFISGMSSQPHWRTPSFFRGVGLPPTSIILPSYHSYYCYHYHIAKLPSLLSYYHHYYYHNYYSNNDGNNGCRMSTQITRLFHMRVSDAPESITLWETYKKQWKITIFNGKTRYKWPCSIAMLVYQRVTTFYTLVDN